MLLHDYQEDIETGLWTINYQVEPRLYVNDNLYIVHAIERSFAVA